MHRIAYSAVSTLIADSQQHQISPGALKDDPEGIFEVAFKLLEENRRLCLGVFSSQEVQQPSGLGVREYSARKTVPSNDRLMMCWLACISIQG